MKSEDKVKAEEKVKAEDDAALEREEEEAREQEVKPGAYIKHMHLLCMCYKVKHVLPAFGPTGHFDIAWSVPKVNRTPTTTLLHSRLFQAVGVSTCQTVHPIHRHVQGQLRPSLRQARKPCPLAARIKKLMQADEDVGKISQATPTLLGAQSWDLCCALARPSGCVSVESLLVKAYRKRRHVQSSGILETCRLKLQSTQENCLGSFICVNAFSSVHQALLIACSPVWWTNWNRGLGMLACEAQPPRDPSSICSTRTKDTLKAPLQNLDACDGCCQRTWCFKLASMPPPLCTTYKHGLPCLGPGVWMHYNLGVSARSTAHEAKHMSAPHAQPKVTTAVSCAARAMELFLKKLVEGTCNVAQSRQAKTVSTSHL